MVVILESSLLSCFMLPEQVLATYFVSTAVQSRRRVNCPVPSIGGDVHALMVILESSVLSCAMLPEQVLASDFAPQAAAAVMRRLSKWAARFIGERGFSIGVDDVIPLPRLSQEVADVTSSSYEACQVCAIFLLCIM